MSLKETITNILFGPKAETEPGGNVDDEQKSAAEETAAAAAAGGSIDSSQLELPPDHPLLRLYDLRRRTSGYLPAPRLCLDADGVLPQEMIQRELGRLRSSMTSVCSARLKQIRDSEKPSRSGKKKPDQEPEAPLCLDALPYFFLSADKLYAWVVVFPPVGPGQELNRELLLRTMLAQEISFGVDERLVDRLSHDDERYFHLYLIAKGKPAFDGKNGNIVDYFPRVLERMLEVALTRSPTIHIGRDQEYPAALVQQRFERLTATHIGKILDGIQENTSRVRNARNYLLAALFNAPSSTDNHYTMLVNHDLYHSG